MNNLLQCAKGSLTTTWNAFNSAAPRQFPARLAPIHQISQRSFASIDTSLDGKKLSFMKMNQAIKENNVAKLSESLKGLSVTDINSRDSEGKLPINRAAEECLKLYGTSSPDVILTLLENGASTTRNDAKNVRFRELLHQIFNKNIIHKDIQTSIAWKKVFELTYFSPKNGDGYMHPIGLDNKNNQK